MTTSAAPLTIGFLSPHNPYDRRSFSGTVFYAASALRRNKRVKLKVLGDHRPPKLRNWLLSRACPKIDHVESSEFEGVDAIVGLVASTLLAPHIGKMSVPYVHVTDATPSFLRDCYGWDVPMDADVLERQVVQHAAANLYSSAEIASRASAEFSIQALHAPFGINLGPAQRPAICPKKGDLNRLELLFVGNDWARKGGDLAVATLRMLQRMGHNPHLTIVGHAPGISGADPAISVVGYLNKNKSDQAAKLAKIYQKAHVLLVPSRADCSPMVIAEAMAFGIPVIASDVGGIRTLVGGAGTGCVLPLQADAATWALQVGKMVSSQMAYQTMSDACFDRANTCLTWQAWCNALLATVDGIFERPAQAAQHAGVAA